MAQILEKKLNVSIEEVSAMIKREIPKSSLSITSEYMEEETIGESKICFYVFEKYIWRVNNRLSLSIVLIGNVTETIIKAVSCGGGTGPIFKMTWGAESDFLYVLEKLINKI